MGRGFDLETAERLLHRHGRVCGIEAGWAKTALDLVASALGLILLSPLLALVALAIKVDSPGPVLFRQTRLGLNGVPFAMYKFRSMRSDSDSEIHRRYVETLIREGGEAEELKNTAGTYKLEGDPRITRVGAMLRATSLDELPQLINVVKGEMSLVGPRPPLPYEAELYTERHARRLEAVPGITGLWQVSGRNETTFEQMVDLDIAYIERRCLALDLRILARTVRVVATRTGA